MFSKTESAEYRQDAGPAMNRSSIADPRRGRFIGIFHRRMSGGNAPRVDDRDGCAVGAPARIWPDCRIRTERRAARRYPSQGPDSRAASHTAAAKRGHVDIADLRTNRGVLLRYAAGVAVIVTRPRGGSGRTVRKTRSTSRSILHRRLFRSVPKLGREHERLATIP